MWLVLSFVLGFLLSPFVALAILAWWPAGSSTPEHLGRHRPWCASETKWLNRQLERRHLREQVVRGRLAHVELERNASEPEHSTLARS
jgi:hypothetical protein